MSLARFAKKRDAVEPEIVEALESFGALVWRIDRPFDLVVVLRKRMVMLEVKTGNKPLTDAQKADLERCRDHDAPVYVVRSVDEALQAIEAVYAI